MVNFNIQKEKDSISYITEKIAEKNKIKMKNKV